MSIRGSQQLERLKPCAPSAPLPGHRLCCLGLRGPYRAGHPDAHAYSSPFPPPSQRPPRVQERRQEPGSQEAAESAAQRLGLGPGREKGDQAVGPRFLPAAPPGGLHGSGPVPRAGPPGPPVPPPCHHPLFPSPSLEGGTKEAGPGLLGCRPGCNWKLCSFTAPLGELGTPPKRKQLGELVTPHG